MRKAIWFVPLALLASACGPDNGLGYYVGGTVNATLRTPDGAEPTTTRFQFPQQTRIDPNLPAGRADGYTGTCNVGPEGRYARITRVGGDPNGLVELIVTLPSWENENSTTAERSLRARVGTAVFSGRQETGGMCRFTTERRGSYGMTISITCQGMTAAADARTLDVEGSLALDGCDGPETRNP